ncbi:MAG: hypothetical protein RIE31_03545 [Alphaproteobacteria bacterium]
MTDDEDEAARKARMRKLLGQIVEATEGRVDPDQPASPSATGAEGRSDDKRDSGPPRRRMKPVVKVRRPGGGRT